MGSLILCLNTGSSSLKFSVYEQNTLFLSGAIEEIKQKEGVFWTTGKVESKEKGHFPTYLQALEKLFAFLDQHNLSSSLTATGHRVVHGGSEFQKPTLINPSVLSKLEEMIPLAPLHLPGELEVIGQTVRLHPKLHHVACFDTAFFHDLPRTSKEFALPKIFFEEKIMRYGFHGLSYEYICSKTKPLPSKVIIAHLGSGASLAALKEGKPIDTSMGFSPAGGIIMGTRPGDLDPGVLIYLMRKKGLNADEIEEIVNKKSGLLALSNLSSDMHVLLREKSTFAIEMFCLDVAKTIGSYFIKLGGLNQLIFTAGIGERADSVRKDICEKLKPLGARLDEQKNKEHASIISNKDSSFLINVIPTNENEMIARHVNACLQTQTPSFR